MRAGRGVVSVLCAAVVACAHTAVAAAAPHAVITDGPPPTTESTDATLSFTSSEPVVVAAYQCRLDGSPWQPCTSPWTAHGLGGGTHRFEVQMLGLLVDSTPAAHTWTIQRQTVAEPPPLAPPPSSGPPPPPPPPPTPAQRRSRFRWGGCDWAAARPGQGTPVQLGRAATCLVNRVRVRRGLPRLRTDPRLEASARSYAQTMVHRRFFAHVTPDGRDFGTRIRATTYVRGPAWSAGEVLAWAARATSPRAEVRELLRSPPHRAILLDPSFRDVGFGVAFGAPVRRVRGGVTYVGHFGRVG